MNPSSEKNKKRSIVRRLNLGKGALTGLIISAPITAIMYLTSEWVNLPFTPFDLFDWITMVLPGTIVTFGIDTMINLLSLLGFDVADTAKSAEQLIAVIQFIILGIIIGMLYFGLFSNKKRKSDYFAGIITGLLIGLPFIAINIAIGQSTLSPVWRILWLIMIFIGWGLSLSTSFRKLFPDDTLAIKESEQDIQTVLTGRRKFILKTGGVALVTTLLGTFAGSILAGSKRRSLEKKLMDSMAHKTETGNGMPFPNLNDPVMPAPGTRPEYTPIKDHYKVFLRTEPTVIDGTTWKLPITGMVDNPLMLTLDEIKNNYEKRDQYVTISCISGKVGTGLIGTTLWSGVSLQKVLADAKVKTGAKYLHISSGDEFYETVDLNLVHKDNRIMLCYAWDGHDLPVDHGYPLRIWIPDRYGMKQPKWITNIEVTDKYKPGYWVERNWDKDAIIKATSVIDTVAVNAAFEKNNRKYVPVGGIAFAGARGISKVEVRVDKGPWQEASLRAPLSETTWVIWRYDWPMEKGEHVFEVRCAEQDGTPQIEEKHSNRPSGSTGIHSLKVNV